jgi:PucR C-terminal helix-turn-helix domain/GGDEF-like domain
MSATVECVAERDRILLALRERTEELIATAVATMRAEIPAYAAAGEAVIDDVRRQVRQHHETKLRCLLAEQDVTLEDLAFTRGAAMRRARAGIALEDYINAFRIGQQVFWDMVLECASETAAGRDAALTLATPLMRYCDVAQTQAGHAFTDFLAHADERRALLEHLLAGELPAHAAAYGITADAQLVVVVAVPASAALARAVLGTTRTLVVVSETEAVGVQALGPGCDARKVCERVAAIHARVGEPLAIAVSTVAAGVTELPRAYAEAQAALEWGGSGVVALPLLSAFGYLTASAPDTARRLIDPALRAFLADDRGVFRDTIRALAEADLVLNVAAERLQIHPNTAKYRLSRIQERTGRNPRRLEDLFELLTAIALLED